MKKQPILPCAFSYMLMEFNELIEGLPTVNEVLKGKLLSLKEQAKNNAELNFNQRRAIVARVNNYIAGDWEKGKEKVPFKAVLN